MPEEDVNGRVPPPEKDADRREYGRHLAMDALMRQAAEAKVAERAARRTSSRHATPSGRRKRKTSSSRRTSERRRRRRSPLPYVLVPLAAAAAVLAAVYLRGPGQPKQVIPTRPTRPIDVQVAEVEGAVFVVRGGNLSSASKGRKLAPGESIRTGATGRAKLLLGDGSTIRISGIANAGLRRESDGRSCFFIESGTVIAEVAKQKAGLAFATPHATGTVLGTHFRVMVGPAATRLDVFGGAVNIKEKSKGKAADVRAGNFAVAEPGAGQSLRLGRIPALSPKYGGVFFEEYAEVYRTKGFALQTTKFKEGKTLRSFTPGEMLAASAGSPLEAEAVEVDREGRKMQALRVPNRTSAFKKLWFDTGWTTSPAFAITMRQRVADSPGQFRYIFAHQEFKPNPKPETAGRFTTMHKTSVGRWHDYSLQFLLVGRLSDGTPLYEKRTVIDGKAYTRIWFAGYAHGFVLSCRRGAWDMTDVKVKELVPADR
ncbi:MAG: FecR family protein [Planctomycetota bacterium]|jgi:ferric-dicitrate binding protein FerR (iron transport regulator)